MTPRLRFAAVLLVLVTGGPALAAQSAPSAVAPAPETASGGAPAVAAPAPDVPPAPVTSTPADSAPAVPTPPAAAATAAPAAAASTAPAGYVIGAEDVLSIVFWRNQDMSAEVAVRPDGRISLPLINEVLAAGLTPEALRTTLVTAAEKFMESPTVTVVVKQINSRKVSITGMVNKPGQYQITNGTSVIQLIAMAGGLLEYAEADNISVIRNENGQPRRYRVNYKDVAKGKNLRQNLELKVGDTVIVP
jgi:polysaccharide export outer membrane protein